MANQMAQLKLQLMVTEVVQLQRLWLCLIGLISSAKPFEATVMCMQRENIILNKNFYKRNSTVVVRGLCNYNFVYRGGKQMPFALKKIGTLPLIYLQ